MQRKARARGGRRFYQEREGTTGRGRPTVAALRLPPRPPELRRRVEDAPLPDKQWFVYDSEGKRFGAYMGKDVANNTLQNQTEKTEIIWAAKYQGSGNITECMVFGRIAARELIAKK